MKGFIQKNLASSGLGLAILLLALVGGASYRSITRLFVVDQWVKHTYTVLEEIDDLSSGLKDAERGRRGYILTSNASFLTTFDTGIQAAKQELKNLRQLTADNPQQQQRLDALQPLMAKRLALLQKSIALRQQNSSNFDIQVTLTEQDKGLHAQVQEIVDEMEVEERELLQRRTKESQVSVRYTIIWLVGGYTASCGLLLGIFWLFQQRIRDRKRSEHALQESERKFCAIFNQTFQFMGLLTPQGIILEINQTALDFAGLQAQDVAGHLFWDGPWWTNSGDRLRVKAAILAAAAGEFVRYEVDVRGAGDQVVTIDFSLKPIRDECDRIVLLIPEGRDIAERKQAEQTLQQSEERWQLAIKGNNEGIWDRNIKTNQTIRSHRFMEILGYEQHELGSSHEEWTTQIHPDDFDRVEAANRDYLDRIAPNYDIEYRVRCKDGTYKWILSRGQAQWDEQGQPVRMVGSISDITQRKQAEAALTQLNTQLEERVKERTAQLEAANRLLLGQKEVLEMLATGASLPDVLNVLIRTIEEQSPQMLCAILLLDADGQTLRLGAAPSLPDSHNTYIDGTAIGPNVGSCGTAGYRGEPVIVSDIALDPLWVNFRDLALNHGLRACWSQPMLSTQGKVLGTFAIYYREPRNPTLKDLKLIETAAHLAGMAIERTQVEQERSRLVAILEASTDYIGTTDPQGNILWNNAQMKKMMGLNSDAESTKRRIPDYHPQWALEVVQNQGLPGAMRDGIWVGETALLRHDGVEIPVSQMIIAHKSPDGSLEYFSTIMHDISNRKRSEAALRESYNLLQTVIDTTPDAIFVKDLQGRYLLINSPGASLFEQSVEEIIGQDDTTLFPPEVAAIIQANDRRILTSGKTEILEEGVIIQGEKRIYLSSKSVYRNPQGNTLGLVGFAKDITPLKQTQKVLQESEERFRATFEQAAVGIAHVSPDGRFVRLNQKFCELLGYTPEEMLTHTFQEMTYPDDLEVDLEYLRLLLTGEIKTYSIEKRYICKDNSLIWANLTVSLVHNSLGEPMYIIGVVQDISSLKETQEALLQINEELEMRVFSRTAQLEQVNTALAESEERLRLFIQNAPNAIAMFDREMRYLATSQRWLFDYNLNEQELIGRCHYDVFPEIPGHWKEDHQNVLKGVVIKTEEDVFVRADGSTDWLRYELHPWYNSTGEVGGIIMFTEIITKRKEAERKLKAALAELTRSNQELEQFAYVASHDLREPLRKIKSYTDLLVKRYQGQLDEKADKYIAYITDGAVRMQTLITDLLTYSRVGRGELSLEPTDLGVILKRTLSDLGTAIQESNAVITTNSLPTVKANPTQMGQLLQNLIANAIKFRGKEPPRIQIRAVRQDKTWTISVQDNGIGIEPQYAERIFVIFQRLHTKEEYSGTGIGLAVCKKIVERHGGQIWLESELGRGTTFLFTLPVS